jgi:hypothetical protein
MSNLAPLSAPLQVPAWINDAAQPCQEDDLEVGRRTSIPRNCLEYFWTCDEVFRFWLTSQAQLTGTVI